MKATLRLLTSFFCFFISINSLQSQVGQQWANYTSGTIPGHPSFEGDKVWSPTQGGLLSFDRNSGLKTIYLPSNSGLKGTSVNEVLVDTGGVKWIASERGGLQRFDDVNWMQYYFINTGDTLIDVIHPCKDSLDRIWFISRVNANCWGCNKLFYLDGNTFTKVDNMPGTGNSNLYRKVIADEHGNIWTQSAFNIALYRPDGDVQIFGSNDIPLSPNELINNIGYDKVRDVVYCTTNASLSSNYTYRLYQYTNNQWIEIPLPDAFGYGREFMNDSDGNFWIYYDYYGPAQDSLYLLKYDGNTWTAHDKDELGLSEKRDFYEARFDDQGHLWISTYENDQYYLKEYQDKQIVQKFNLEIFPLRSNYVDAVGFDYSGNTWVANYDIISLFDGLAWKLFTESDMGFPIGQVKDITADPVSGSVYIAFDSGDNLPSFARFDGQQFIPVYLPGNPDVYKIWPAANGKIWLATNKGLGYFDGINWTWYNTANSPLTHNLLWNVMLDHQNNVWIEGYYDKIYRFDGANWLVFDMIPGYNSLLCCDNNGTMWVSGDYALYRFDGSEWLPVNVPFKSAQAMTQDPDGTYWIANGGGLSNWDGSNNWVQYDVTNSPINDNYITSINIDDSGNKWLKHSLGLSVFNPNGVNNAFVQPAITAGGKVFFDQNQNGMAEMDDPAIPNQKIRLLPDSIFAFTDFNGTYRYTPSNGNYTIDCQPEPSFSITSAPLNYNVAITSDTIIQGLDFGIWRNDIPDSIQLYTSTGLARCNLPVQKWIQVTNQAYTDFDGRVQLIFDPALSFVSSEPAPAAIDGNTLTWQLDNLAFLHTFLAKIIFDNVSANMPGDSLQFLTMVAAENDGNYVNISRANEVITVRCSFDPNDKQVSPQGPSLGALSLKANPLDYTVRFQNTGNDTAFVVVIRDTLDPHLDVATFEVLGSSHPVRTLLAPGGIVTFIFDQINLLWQKVDDAGSQGFVSYRIKARSGIPDGTPVNNTAHIYFDFNPAIVTNTTSNTLVEELPTVAIPHLFTAIDWDISPNPSTGQVWLQLPAGIHSVQIVAAVSGSMQNIVIPTGAGLIQGLVPGVYWVRPDDARCGFKKLIVLEKD